MYRNVIRDISAVVVLGAAMSMVSSGQATAQTSVQLSPAEAPIAEPAGAIPLEVRPGSQVAAVGTERWMKTTGFGLPQVNLVDVSQPTLTPVLPAKGTANGAAVIVAPGGGFYMLSMEREGWLVARWLAERGVTAFVLKYRLRPIADLLGPVPPSRSARKLEAFAPAVEDAQSAVRLVRSRAATWGIDPNRVGMIGFSAGALTTLAIGAASPSINRPDFIAPIYPPMDAISPPSDGPPMFVALASDDPLFGGKGFGLIEAWQRAHVPVEFHLYEKGGHGFGAPGEPNTTSIHMMEEFYWWMEARGMMKPPSPKQ